MQGYKSNIVTLYFGMTARLSFRELVASFKFNGEPMPDAVGKILSGFGDINASVRLLVS